MNANTSFTDFFIHRPVFSWVMNIVVILLGITGFVQLSTQQYPSTEGTSVSLEVRCPGGDMAVNLVEAQITRPLEEALSSLKGLHVMSSETVKGSTLIRMRFKNRSVDLAASDVREELSKEMEKIQKVVNDRLETNIYKSNNLDGNVMDLAVTNPNLLLADLFYIGEKVLKNTLESINGVAAVKVYGGSSYRMLILIDPLKMAAYQLTAMEIKEAIKKNNFELSAGQLIEPEREYSITTQFSFKTPKEFEEIVVANRKQRFVRLKDVATVKLQPGEESSRVFYNGQPAVALEIMAQADANAIFISKEVQKRIAEIEKTLASGTKIHVAMDKSLFIKASIDQVYQALIEAIGLVLLVIFLFLRSFRAALIPVIAIPTSLIGTFLVMYVLGFTLNVLTLLAMVLAIGLVVDDAIVVLENVYRYIEKGMKPMQAALKGTREVSFSVIAMTLTLVAVYAPISMAPGVVGKLFKEFALTLAASVLLSGFTALTLSPAMCARLLKAHGEASSGQNVIKRSSGTVSKLDEFLEKIREKFSRIQNYFFQFSKKIEKALGHLDDFYTKAVAWTLDHRQKVFLSGLLFSLACSLWGWLGMKKELAPPSDTGLLNVYIIRPPTRTMNYMLGRVPKIETALKGLSEVTKRLLLLDEGDSSSIQASLRSWKERDSSCEKIAQKLNDRLKQIEGFQGQAYCPTGSMIKSGGDQFPLSFLLLTHRSGEELERIGQSIKMDLRQYPGIDKVHLYEKARVPEYIVRLKSDKISALNVNPLDVAEALNMMISKNQIVGTFQKGSEYYNVIAQLNQKFRRSLSDLSALFIRGYDEKNQSKIVPLNELVEFVLSQSEAGIDHHMKKRSYEIRASLKPGYGLANVYTAFLQSIRHKIPNAYEIVPTGELRTYFEEQGSITLIFVLALAFIFLIMAAQFESLIDPLIIMFTVPLAIGGGILSLVFLSEGSLNIYSQIGLITLIGLIVKHGILLVDFANQAKNQGLGYRQAILKACHLRLRPIVMTTLAMVLGALPLLLATGAGAEARRQIGCVIVGGMTIGTLFTLFIVPIIYLFFHPETLKSDPSENFPEKMDI